MTKLITIETDADLTKLLDAAQADTSFFVEILGWTTEQAVAAKLAVAIDEIEAARKPAPAPVVDTLTGREVKAHKCTRCCGRGRIDAYHYVDAGRCFKCGGSGETYH